MNIEFTQGDTHVHDFSFTNPDGTPVDLMNYVARLAARLRMDDATPIFELTGPGLTTGLDFINPANNTQDPNAGVIRARFSTANTALLDWHGAHYDLQLTNPVSEVTTIAKGRLNPLTQVTR